MMDYITTHAGVIGLLVFVVFFGAMFLWTFRPGSKKLYKEHSQIPLEENE
ncbi:MAG: cbb3-type cytochrome oxidase subunit 3 [Alphaproteobacteria bacterium]